VRLGLSNMRCLVLLLGKRAQAGAALAESAAELLMRMPIPSSVHLVGTDGAALELAASILRSSPGQQVTQTCVGMRGGDRLDAVLELIAGMAPTACVPLDLELG
ncbi:MAG TPA: hypothetical protein VNN06_01260, partial [Ramlibacter sp.]|nr:hypothetical protein [Ramlibacter sp.]